MDKLPRVCVVSPLYHPHFGGVGRQAVALTEALHEKGVQVFVICRMMKCLPQWRFNPDIRIVRAFSVGSRTINLQEKTLWNLLVSLTFCLSLMIILIRTRRSYDIVHFHGASLPLITSVLLLKALGKKVVAKVTGARMDIEAGSFKGKYLFLGAIFIWLLRRVDAFVAISSEIRDDLVKDGFAPQKIYHISNFIASAEFYPPSGTAQKEEKKRALIGSVVPLILFSGRLAATKRLDVLLRAFRSVVASGITPQLVILGDGIMMGALVTLAEELGIGNQVLFKGFVPNVRDYLHAADIFVFPSEREGMPNAVLEAMACGLPVIAACAGGVADVIEDGDNGLLTVPGDVDQLRDVMLRLLGNAELREKLSANAVRTIERSHSIARAAGRYIDLYRGLLRAD